MKALCYFLSALFTLLGALFVFRVVEMLVAGQDMDPALALFALLFPFFAFRNWQRARRMGGGNS